MATGEATEQQIRDLIKERNKLHYKVLFSTQMGDVSEYLDVFSDNVPRIIEIEKALHQKEIEGIDIEEIARSIKVAISPSQGSKSELEVFEDELRSRLYADGLNPNPDKHNTQRADGITKKKSPGKAAKNQAKQTEDREKLFRRGKALLELNRKDLCKPFWLKLGNKYRIEPPTTWGGNGSSSSSSSHQKGDVIEVRKVSEFTAEEKARVFDQILELGSEILRRVLEDGDDPKDYYADMFCYIMPLLGPATASVLGINQIDTKLSTSDIKVSGA